MADKKTYCALGIMSGTSLDGLDLALCRFTLIGDKWEYEIFKSETILYPEELMNSLKNSFFSKASEIAELHTRLGNYIGLSAKRFLGQTKIKVDLIASHGQTIFHNPSKGYTFQIGSGAEIAVQTGVVTICDFRSMDVARGGQGAPLVPIGDELLFSGYSSCLNLGGFANVSFRNEKNQRIAFDVCPVNFVLNRLANQLGEEYDAEGKIAGAGVIIEKLLSYLNNEPYYNQPYPKSLGQEWVEQNVLPELGKYSDIHGTLRTYSEHIAHQVSMVLNNIEGKQVLVTGGGCYNNFLINLLKQKCEKEIIIPSQELIDMKEALIFAFLGVLRLLNIENSFASVTGASGDSVNGAIYRP